MSKNGDLIISPTSHSMNWITVRYTEKNLGRII